MVKARLLVSFAGDPSFEVGDVITGEFAARCLAEGYAERIEEVETATLEPNVETARSPRRKA